MEIKPQKVNVSEDWKDWCYEAFQLSKKTFITIPLVLVIIGLAFAYLSIQFSEYHAYVIKRFSMIFFIPALIYYFYALNIKYDDNNGLTSPSLNKKGFTDVIMFQSFLFIFGALLGNISPEYIESLEITPGIQRYFNSFLSIGFSIGTILASTEIIMMFLGLGVLKSINYLWEGVKKNVLLFVQLFFLTNIIYLLLGATYQLPFLYLIIFAIFPFQVSLVYVVFKNIYLNISPQKRKKVESRNEAYAR